MRPKKTRWVSCSTEERHFIPTQQGSNPLENILLTLDEFETLRLCDGEGQGQAAVATQMKVHRTTVSRILASARYKIADALINLKEIHIAGGCCSQIIGEHSP